MDHQWDVLTNKQLDYVFYSGQAMVCFTHASSQVAPLTRLPALTVCFCGGGAPRLRDYWGEQAPMSTARTSVQPGEQQKDCGIPGISRSLYRKRDWEVCGTITLDGRLWSCPVVLARQKPAHNSRRKTHKDSEECLRCSGGQPQGGLAAHGTIWLGSQ